MNDARTSAAIDLMLSFADRTGITSDMPGRRYLWTDAFAVCNFLGLERATGASSFGSLALRLVDQVHRQLGRHRADDVRTGWLGGISGTDGEAHPTCGGLRIGKPLSERSPAEPFDPDLEWDRDGQYFHYLTQWAHALDQLARAKRRAHLHAWARELMHTAHRAFVYGPAGRKRMFWKLSIDLSRPLVASMGQHDPLDGLVTCAQLDATAALFEFPRAPDLTAAMEDYAQMLDVEALATTDPLGIGGLLLDSSRLVQMEFPQHPLVDNVLAAGVDGLTAYASAPSLGEPAHRRLAFRELGLAIGLAAIDVLRTDIRADRLGPNGRRRLGDLARYLVLRDEIESFWMRLDPRQSRIWIDHADINDVMLATSLVPSGFVVLPARDGTTTVAS
jgi:hypothetical protein